MFYETKSKIRTINKPKTIKWTYMRLIGTTSEHLHIFKYPFDLGSVGKILSSPVREHTTPFFQQT